MKKEELDVDLFIKQLIDAAPGLRIVLDEHINYYDEFLSHVFMGDATRFIEEVYNSNPESMTFLNLINVINEGFELGNLDVQNLILVSFLENLACNQNSSGAVKALLSTELLAELK